MRIRYEDKIKMTLEMRCGAISASETLKQRIDKEVSMKKTVHDSRHFSGKKFAIGVAAACLLLSGSVFAGKTRGYVSGYESSYSSYAELDKAEEKLGFCVDVAERFDNGYSFEEMQVENTRAVDEEGKTLYTFPELSVQYAKDGIRDIILCVDKRPEKEEDEKAPDLTDQCGDIALRYDVYTYKFVPVDYELTEEDRANLERDDYEISVGTDEVEYAQMTHVTWEKDGVYYELLGDDTALSGEEMLEMAKEIINAN